jgi:uncharacterized protein (DUF2235 family)
MPKNIVICCDGTNNEFGICNTSVVRLMQVATQDDSTQVVYYDPGVGTLPDPSAWTRIAKKISEWKALGFGTDIEGKVTTAYSHLMDVWELGDKVFLFGFSRGAYTARVLAGMLHALGLLAKGNGHLLPYAMEVFRSLRKNKENYWALCENFRWTFARPIAGDDSRRFPLHFVGLWDTVSSVGYAWNPARYQYSYRNPSVKTIRHAVSLDERRWFFRQNQIGDVPGQDASEVWFAGVHSDVGGGYPENGGGLWRVAFEWLLGEAQAKGLLVDGARLATVRTRTAAPQRPWAEPQHESLTGIMWHLAEYVPKHGWDPVKKRDKWSIGAGRGRFVHNGAQLHKSVLDRMREVAYAPANISSEFVASVKRLPSVPIGMPYASGSNRARP